MAIWLRTNRDTFDVEIPEADRLKTLQRFVGGDIQIIALGAARPLGQAATDYYLVVHENGKALNLPVNHKATELVKKQIVYDDLVVGDVLICTSDEIA